MPAASSAIVIEPVVPRGLSSSAPRLAPSCGPSTQDPSTSVCQNTQVVSSNNSVTTTANINAKPPAGSASTVSIIPADDLATSGARSSAGMILTQTPPASKSAPVTAPVSTTTTLIPTVVTSTSTIAQLRPVTRVPTPVFEKIDDSDSDSCNDLDDRSHSHMNSEADESDCEEPLNSGNESETETDIENESMDPDEVLARKNSKTNDKASGNKPDIGRQFLPDEVQCLSTIPICSIAVPIIVVEDTLYLSVKEIFTLLEKIKRIQARGFGWIDAMLLKSEVDLAAAFLKKTHTRIWISKPALLVILESDVSNRKHISEMVLKELDRQRWNVCRLKTAPKTKGTKEIEPTNKDISEDVTDSDADLYGLINSRLLMNMDGQAVECKLEDDKLYVDSCTIIDQLGLKGQRDHRGFTYIDKRLVKEGLEDVDACYLYKKKVRTHMDLYAAYLLMRSYRKEKPLAEALVAAVQGLMERNANFSSIDTKRKRPKSVKEMINLIDIAFGGNTKKFLDGLASLISTLELDESQDILNVKNLVQMLTQARKQSEHGKSVVDRAVEIMYHKRLVSEEKAAKEKGDDAKSDT